MANWNPKEKPFRVSGVRNSSQAGCFGWAYVTPRTFATLSEAIEAAREKMPAGTRCYDIDEALNAETWGKNGRWKRVANRKPREALKFTEYGRKRVAELGVKID